MAKKGGISKGGTAVVKAKVQAGIRQAFGLSNKPAPARAPSGRGPGAAKARAGIRQAFGRVPDAPRAPSGGTGPVATKVRAGLSKLWSQF